MRTITKKLTVARQTLRSLSTGDLGRVQGAEIEISGPVNKTNKTVIARISDVVGAIDQLCQLTKTSYDVPANPDPGSH